MKVASRSERQGLAKVCQYGIPLQDQSNWWHQCLTYEVGEYNQIDILCLMPFADQMTQTAPNIMMVDDASEKYQQDLHDVDDCPCHSDASGTGGQDWRVPAIGQYPDDVLWSRREHPEAPALYWMSY